MSEPAIEAVELSKKFRIKSEARQSVKERLIRGKTDSHRDFWALRDATFSVPRGASLGLIGHNGSGKSTALKVLAGIYRPTSGYVRINGRVSALLEVGAGFHPDLTGRENVKLNGAVLGLSGQEINRLMDQIIEFADIGEFIDNPIKHYSSGMHVRLGFAVAVMVRPEILIVDEVIAVGDEEFQRKCYDHLHDLRSSGTTMLIVSHGMGQINQLCDEAVWLEHGRVQQVGPSRKVTQAYLDRVNENEAAKVAHEVEEVAADQPGRRGSGEVRIVCVEKIDADGQPTPFLVTGQRAVLRLHYECSRPLPGASVTVSVTDGNGAPVVVGRSDSEGTWDFEPGAGHVDWVWDGVLAAPGPYEVWTELTTGGQLVDADPLGLPLVIRDGGQFPGGYFNQPGTWRLRGSEG